MAQPEGNIVAEEFRTKQKKIRYLPRCVVCQEILKCPTVHFFTWPLDKERSRKYCKSLRVPPDEIPKFGVDEDSDKIFNAKFSSEPTLASLSEDSLRGSMATSLLEKEKDKKRANVTLGKSLSEQKRDSNGNLWWCACTFCRVQDMERTSFCCAETFHSDAIDAKKIAKKLRDINSKEAESDYKSNSKSSMTCISLHDEFQELCLSKTVLNQFATVITKRGQKTGPNPGSNEYFRYWAYRLFTVWIHGKLKYQERREIPACATEAIRNQFPLEEGESYSGFKDASSSSESESDLSE